MNLMEISKSTITLVSDFPNDYVGRIVKGKLVLIYLNYNGMESTQAVDGQW